MYAPKIHLKRPFSPMAPYTRVTLCGEVIGSIAYWEYSHTTRIKDDKWCAKCVPKEVSKVSYQA